MGRGRYCAAVAVDVSSELASIYQSTASDNTPGFIVYYVLKLYFSNTLILLVSNALWPIRWLYFSHTNLVLHFFANNDLFEMSDFRYKQTIVADSVLKIWLRDALSLLIRDLIGTTLPVSDTTPPSSQRPFPTYIVSDTINGDAMILVATQCFQRLIESVDANCFRMILLDLLVSSVILPV